jgi:hypothetical protein
MEYFVVLVTYYFRYLASAPKVHWRAGAGAPALKQSLYPVLKYTVGHRDRTPGVKGRGRVGRITVLRYPHPSRGGFCLGRFYFQD